jgi:hypothetical protein
MRIRESTERPNSSVLIAWNSSAMLAKGHKLGCAYRRKIGRVREKDDPFP